jgi:hypothetical protein
MIIVGILVRLEAKPSKEGELAAFLMQGLELANPCKQLVRSISR